MPFAAGKLYRWLGRQYLWLYVGFEVTTALIITLATVGLFRLYTPGVSDGQFWRTVLLAESLVALALVYTVGKAIKMAKPLSDWLRTRDPDGAPDAWRVAITIPRRLVVVNGWKPFAIISLPSSIFYTIELQLPAYTALIIMAGSCIAIAYAGVLHFFASELFLRPVVEDIAERLPPDFEGQPAGVPLRWKLLGALPIISVVTGVVTSGLSTDGTTSLNELGLDVGVALALAFTVSLEMTLLITKSVVGPINDLVDATRRVRAGDLEARVPVMSGDEMGALAGSFNEMMRGLSEREALRQAFGSYVDPDVAERVLDEGELLEGQEREVTVMFVDVRDFTPFAEHSSARETVAFLNDFFDTVVPVVIARGGHANKFLGDGLLCVFGAPERIPDHADRALACALDVAAKVRERFDGSIGIGIGLNSGPVVVGSVGGGGRLEFSVIGDAVNVAARVEAHTRETGDTILLTEATRCLLERSPSEPESRGAIELKGKSEPVPLYACDGSLDERSMSRQARLTAEA
ncbi:MAG TPA: adenylate/guanylate cyclase domain-containing protein [Thermoleophilaceae bacterium]|jgi:class 3 adenylate cyclase